MNESSNINSSPPPQQESSIQREDPKTSVQVGVHKLAIKQDNLPTNSPDRIRAIVLGNLPDMADSTIRSASRYFGGRAQLAERKVETSEKLLSNRILGPIIKRILQLGTFGSRTLEDIRHVAAWKVEAYEFKALAEEIRDAQLARAQTADPRAAASFVRSSDEYAGAQREIDRLTKELAELRASGGSDAAIMSKQSQLDSEVLRQTRLERLLVADNYNQFKANLIDQIPNLMVAHREYSLEIPLASDFNNNGMPLPAANIKAREGVPQASIDRDGEDIPLIPVEKAVINGEEHTMARGFGYYDPAAEMLFMERDDARYHDVVLVSGGNNKPAVMSLADGSGHGEMARPVAKRIAEVAHNHVAESIQECADLHHILSTQLDAVKLANDSAASDNIEGQTTFIQTAIVGNVLSCVSVGDSKVFVFRPKADGQGWTCIDPLQNGKGTLDAKNAGGQLSGIQEENGKYTELNAINAFAMYLEEGDIVFACSDGYVDNFNPAINHEKLGDLDGTLAGGDWELENPAHIKAAQGYSKKLIEELIRDCSTGEEINDALKAYIQTNTLEKKIQFLTNPSRETESKFRGKLDDAASCYMVYATGDALEDVA